MFCKRFLILVALVLWGVFAGAQASLLRHDTQMVDLAAEASLLEDPSGHLTLQDLSRPEVAKRFTSWEVARGDVNLGFSTSVWWVRVRLKRTAEAPPRWILDVPYAYNKYLDFYAPGRPPVLTGHARPLANRPIFSRHFAFPIEVSETPQDYYFRVESSYAISLPMVAWQVSAYAEHTLKVLLFEFLYYGALLVLVVYAGFFWLLLRDARYGYYALFGLCLDVGMFASNGLGAVYLWPNLHVFDEISAGLFFSAAGTFFLLFARGFLQTPMSWPFMDRVLRFFGFAFAILTVLFAIMVGRAVWVQGLFQAMVVLSPVSFAAILLVMTRRRVWQQPGVGYFGTGLLCLALGTVVATLRTVNWLPANGFTAYPLQISSALEMFFFSFALAEMVRDDRRQRLQAQADFLAAKEDAIQLLQEQAQRLEVAVKDRTQELHQALLREHGTLAQYLRFASLVSHEFRNRLNVISSQSDMLRKDVPMAATHARTEVIKRSVNHLANLTDKWLDGDRLLHSEIRASVSAVELLPWLEMLLDKSPQYAETHPILLDGVPTAAHIHADSELLEIAMGNLIDNACKYSPPGGVVRISLVHQPGMTGIAVQDYGHGIAKADQEKLFEPYVRLRPEGAVSGSGLGLNFVRRIAEAHGGKVTLECPPDQGSIFVIWFPDVNDE